MNPDHGRRRQHLKGKRWVRKRRISASPPRLETPPQCTVHDNLCEEASIVVDTHQRDFGQFEGIRDEIRSSTRGKVGGLLIRPTARRFREHLDPDTYDKAYLLGLRGLAVIAHGNSSHHTIANAIQLAARGVEHRLVERLAERLGTTVLASARPETPTPQAR